jgi:hypothetical protein
MAPVIQRLRLRMDDDERTSLELVALPCVRDRFRNRRVERRLPFRQLSSRRNSRQVDGSFLLLAADPEHQPKMPLESEEASDRDAL